MSFSQDTTCENGVLPSHESVKEYIALEVEFCMLKDEVIKKY